MRHRCHGVTAILVAVLTALPVLTACGTGDHRPGAALTDASASASPLANGPTPSGLPSPTPQGSLPALGSATSTKWPGLTLTVNAVEPGADGLLNVVWTMANHSSADFDLTTEFMGSPYNYVGGGTQAVTITDHTAKQRYYPLVDDSVHCQCYSGTENNNNGGLPQGKSQIAFDVYRPETTPSTVEIDAPGFTPIKNVPVSH